jgi:ABC-type uncharacterized transport system ATPase subunit
VKRFAANFGVHVWFVAHPAKNEYMRIREGELTVATGIPGMGKSELIGFAIGATRSAKGDVFGGIRP